MKRMHWLIVLAAVMAAGGTAAAVGKGGALFITSRNTRLQKDSSPQGALVELLQPGKEVSWQGADATNKQWHKVTVDGRTGVVFQSNLSTHKPAMELIASPTGGQPVDPQAFASSGAATKALSEAGMKYADAKRWDPEVPRQVITAEAVSAQVSPDEIDAHARKAGISSAFNKLPNGGGK